METLAIAHQTRLTHCNGPVGRFCIHCSGPRIVSFRLGGLQIRVARLQNEIALKSFEFQNDVS